MTFLALFLYNLIIQDALRHSAHKNLHGHAAGRILAEHYKFAHSCVDQPDKRKICLLNRFRCSCFWCYNNCTAGTLACVIPSMMHLMMSTMKDGKRSNWHVFIARPSQCTFFLEKNLAANKFAIQADKPKARLLNGFKKQLKSLYNRARLDMHLQLTIVVWLVQFISLFQIIAYQIKLGIFEVW